MHGQRIHILRPNMRAYGPRRWSLDSTSELWLLASKVTGENSLDLLEGVPNGLGVPEPNEKSSSPGEANKEIEVLGSDMC